VNATRIIMRTRYQSLALLALLGVSTTLAAQGRVIRPESDRDEIRRYAGGILSRFGVDPDRPRLGITTGSGGARDTLGVLVDDVTEGGPAQKAGIREGDRIVAINGISLQLNPADADDPEMQGVVARRLTRELGRQKVGDEVELRLMRDGRPVTLKVKTVAAEDLTQTRTALASGGRWDADRASLGIGLGSAGTRRDTLGILVTNVLTDGPAEKAGIEEGDRIASINGVDLRVAREDAGDWAASNARARRLHRELEKVKAGDDVELRLYRAGQPRTVRVKAIAARDLPRNGRGMFIIGDGAGFGDFNFSVPPVPPMPPTPPVAPLPPDAPRFYYDDSEDGRRVRIRMAPRVRLEARADAMNRARQTLERALQRMPLNGGRLRLELDGDLQTT